MGNATTTSVIAAESLVRNGYADYVSLETKTINVEVRKKRTFARPSDVEPEVGVLALADSEIAPVVENSADVEITAAVEVLEQVVDPVAYNLPSSKPRNSTSATPVVRPTWPATLTASTSMPSGTGRTIFILYSNVV